MRTYRTNLPANSHISLNGKKYEIKDSLLVAEDDVLIPRNIVTHVIIDNVEHPFRGTRRYEQDIITDPNKALFGENKETVKEEMTEDVISEDVPRETVEEVVEEVIEEVTEETVEPVIESVIKPTHKTSKK